MIVGISGKIGSGKDEIGRIIQYLTHVNTNTDSTAYEDWCNMIHYNMGNWKVKKFADKLKGGCEYDFPNEFSVKEWETGDRSYRNEIMPSLGISRRDFLLKREDNCRAIHPDYFVNALFADYKAEEEIGLYDGGRFDGQEAYRVDKSNWIITDCIFPNEAQAIKNRGGIVIRVNINASELERCLRDPVYFVENYTTINGNKINLRDADKSFILEHFTHKEEHPSETALDNGTTEELIEKVREILVKERII